MGSLKHDKTDFVVETGSGALKVETSIKMDSGDSGESEGIYFGSAENNVIYNDTTYDSINVGNTSIKAEKDSGDGAVAQIVHSVGGRAASLLVGTFSGLFSFQTASAFGIGEVDQSRILSSDGTVITYRIFVTSGGTGRVGMGTTSPQGKLELAGTEDTVVFTATAHSTQTADLSQWRNNSGTVLSRVYSDGAMESLDRDVLRYSLAMS